MAKKPTIYKNFAFNEKDYSFGELAKILDGNAKHTEKEYRSEYTRLYKVAKSRLARFEEAGLTKSKTYRHYSKTIKAQSSLSSEQFVSAMVDLHKFLTSETGTVTGARQADAKAIKELQEKGFSWVNQDNLYDFYDFLDKMISAGYNSIYGSDRMIEVFETAILEEWDTDDVFAEFDNFMSQKKDRTGTRKDLTAFKQSMR